MCRMVGVVFKDEFPLTTLVDLRYVSEAGKIPGEKEPGHRDGWGIVSFRGGSSRYIGRSPREAFLDPSYDSALEDIQALDPPNILIAHVRAASRGGASLANTHPFVVDGIVLGHNGTINDFHPKTSRKPKGETDSERLALLLADRYEEKRDLKEALRSVVLDDIAKHDFTAAILLVSDGKILLGYRDYTKLPRYYSLRVAKCSTYVAMYQQSHLGYKCKTHPVKKGEMVSVGLDLRVQREMVR